MTVRTREENYSFEFRYTHSQNRYTGAGLIDFDDNTNQADEFTLPCGNPETQCQSGCNTFFGGQGGKSFQVFDPEEQGLNFSDYIGVNVHADVSLLMAEPWPDDPIPPPPGTSWNQRSVPCPFEWVHPAFDSSGAIISQPGCGEVEALASGICYVDGGCARAVNVHRPISDFAAGDPEVGEYMVDMVASISRSRVYSSPNARHCIRFVPFGERFDFPPFDCRVVQADANGWVDVPTPESINLTAYFDEFCDCENLAP